MKNFLALLIFGFVTFGITAAQAAEEFSPNLHLGNYALSGSVQLERESSSSPIAKDTTYFDVDLSGEYFLMDDLSAGLSFSLDTVSNKDSVGTLGPSASWYFWKAERLASFVHAGYSFGLTEATVISRSTLSAGLNYFVTQSVAIGPSIFWKHFHSHFTDYNRFGIMAGISVYL